ncbi:response regulator [Falsibacillus albus]|uniref:Response regulator n=1 Tax=Falsibacillus albus TaxID=2478915 RepID=A0A3L7K2Q7_9BACI|nr:response regulator [Falsibacillus albus]RLQ96629.1 response regulator [Falsibacillus albus]
MKLLIVEDEEIERIALLQILSQSHAEWEFCLAENGKQGIDAVKGWEPDVILMDIKMPLIDGLEASERILREHPFIKIIIVSSYDTFDYAQKALRIGVKDYLLKPSKQKEIIHTVEKVVLEAAEEKRDREKELVLTQRVEAMLPFVESDIVTQLIFDYVHAIHLEESLKLVEVDETVHFYMLVLRLDGGTKEERAAGFNVIKAALKSRNKCWFGPFSGSQAPIILFYSEQQASYRSHAYQCTQHIFDSLKPGNVEATVGIGRMVMNLEEVRTSYYEALRASGKAFQKKRISFYTELIEKEDDGASMWVEIEQNIMEQFYLGNEDQIRSLLANWMEQQAASQTACEEIQQKLIDLFAIMKRYLEEIGYSYTKSFPLMPLLTYRHLKAELNQSLDHLFLFLEQNSQKHESEIAYKVKKYIKDHFTKKDMSLDTLAEAFQLTPQYISKIFKEQCEISYIDFLTKCRIKHAKKLMEGQKSLKEIAYLVGYQDPNYFSRVFKRTCQMSPSQYKRSLIVSKR